MSRVGKLSWCLIFSLLMQNGGAREVSELNRDWTFQFGDEATGKVSIPHTWNAIDGADGAGPEKTASVNSNGYKRGVATYTKLLNVKVLPGQRYFVKCDGASICAEVFVNGKSAGTHKGAFTAFCFEVTDLLKNGANEIIFKVDNSLQTEIVPLVGDFSMFGGIYRPVSLIETNDVAISPIWYASPGVFAKTKSITKEEAKIQLDVYLTSKTKGLPVVLSYEILDDQNKVVAQGNGKKEVGGVKEGEIFTFNDIVIKNPKLWQTRRDSKNPALYRVKVTLRGKGISDEVSVPLGLRTIEISPKQGFVLNGKPMQVRGVNRHQDWEGKGWAISPENEETDMRLIYEMGADGLRTAHYPQTTNIYNMTDKMGIVVWSEVPCVGYVVASDSGKENIWTQAKEMIWQHYNHPSICVWGLFNEIYFQAKPGIKPAEQENLLTELNKEVVALDPSRPTVAASNQADKKTLNRIPQHISFNFYPGWYGGPPERMANQLDHVLKTYPERGIAISEYGHGASIHMHENPAKQPKPISPWHPEEWQAVGHEVNYREIKKRPQIWGSFVWNMFDFGADARKEGEKLGRNDKGLVTYDRKTKKDAFYFYQANWSTEPMVRITGERFSQRSQKNVPVKVYSNAREVELFVNEKSLGRVAVDDLKRAVWPNVELKEGENKLEAKTVGEGSSISHTIFWTLKPNDQKPEKYSSLKD